MPTDPLLKLGPGYPWKVKDSLGWASKWEQGPAVLGGWRSSALGTQHSGYSALWGAGSSQLPSSVTGLPVPKRVSLLALRKPLKDSTILSTPHPNYRMAVSPHYLNLSSCCFLTSGNTSVQSPPDATKHSHLKAPQILLKSWN